VLIRLVRGVLEDGVISPADFTVRAERARQDELVEDALTD